MSRASARGWLLLVSFFAAGIVVGYAIGHLQAARPPANPMEPHAFVERLSGELGLDAAQRASITDILAAPAGDRFGVAGARTGCSGDDRLRATGNHGGAAAGSARDVHEAFPRSARKYGRPVRLCAAQEIPTHLQVHLSTDAHPGQLSICVARLTAG